MINATRMRKTPVLLMLVIAGLVLGGCSADARNGRSATAPGAGADLAVNGEPITVCVENCIFEQQGANLGLGCAANVRGTTRLSGRDGRTLARMDWQLDASWVVRPGETFLYDGCCFDDSVEKQTVRYETEFRWDDVSCPGS